MVGNFVQPTKTIQFNTIEWIQSLQNTLSTIRSHYQQLQRVSQQYISIQQEITAFQLRYDTIQQQLVEQKQLVYELSANRPPNWNQQKQIIHYHLQTLQTGKYGMISQSLTLLYFPLRNKQLFFD